MALGRRRRSLAHGEPRSEHQLPSVLLRRHSRRSAESRIASSRSPARCTCRKTAAERSARSRATCTATTRRCGSIRRTRSASSSGSDGGWQVSYDGGKNFEVVNNVRVHAVLPHQLRHAEAVHDVRRPAGQRQLVRAEPGAVGPGHPQERLVHRVAAATDSSPCRMMDKPWLVYSDAQGGMLNITDTRTGTQKTIYPYPNRVGSVGDAMISHKYRFNWNSPIALSPHESEGRVLRRQRAVQVDRLRQVVAGHLARPHDERSREAGELRRPDRRRQHGGRIPLHDPDDRAVAARLERHLGRHRRRQRAGDARRRQDVEQRLHERAGPQAERVDPDRRGVALRRGHRVRRGRPPSGRRLRAVRVHDDGLRQDVEARSRAICRRRRRGRTSCARIRAIATCSTSAPRWACGRRGIAGAHWMSIRGDLPPVPVRDIQVHPRDNDLLLATHGRGLYIMDDITALQKLGAGDDGRCDAVRHSARDALGACGAATATSARRSGRARIRRLARSSRTTSSRSRRAR